MANTTITFRTDEELKRRATELFESLGMNLSVAINMFMRQ
ncbi:MAG: type II toxin-antitoxin system RelB/DinJ family antitoxin, partial [Lachnospiraceae bacterium]|nr:type II toxin-antitoxin system RelB/DinJ family antitoxin [Lachnospiraceae bacterium]